MQSLHGYAFHAVQEWAGTPLYQDSCYKVSEAAVHISHTGKTLIHQTRGLFANWTALLHMLATIMLVILEFIYYMSCSVQVLSCTKEASHLELKMCLVLGKPTKHSGWKSAASLLSCWYTQFSWSEIIWRGGVEGASPETWIYPVFITHSCCRGNYHTPTLSTRMYWINPGFWGRAYSPLP